MLTKQLIVGMTPISRLILEKNIPKMFRQTDDNEF